MSDTLVGSPPSPERAALNLAHVVPISTPCAPPAPGSADARMPLKLLAWRVQDALAQRGTVAARERLANLHAPDLWAGTVQDGTARGFAVALDEALSLCKPVPAEPDPLDEPLAKVFTGKELRKVREHVLSAGGARVRFTRKGGIHLIDRGLAVDAVNCIGFDDRADMGTLDGFEAKEGERPRVFSPSFLQPVVAIHGAAGDRLVLRGRLGRSPQGFPCEMVLEARRHEPRVRMTLRIENRHQDHRLRLRAFLPEAAIAGEGTPPFERITFGHRWFLATTLVRACGRLRVGDALVAVPDAQCLGTIELRFWLGAG